MAMFVFCSFQIHIIIIISFIVTASSGLLGRRVNARQIASIILIIVAFYACDLSLCINLEYTYVCEIIFILGLLAMAEIRWPPLSRLYQANSPQF